LRQAITSADTASAIDENSGAGQVVYTATASDADFNGAQDFTFSLADDAVYTTTVPSVDAPDNTQLVSVASYSSQDANGQITVKVNYNADSDQLTGLGLRIHFDSSVLTVADINNVLDQDLINTDSDAQADTDNLDGNASTDSYVTVAWASLDGDWPSEALTDELLTLVFDVADDAAGSTDIGFSTSSTPVGYGFSGDAIAIDLMESPLSIDSATGEVTLSDNPDFDSASEYSFSVIATDAAGNASAPQAVTLAINEVDDVPPVITSADTAATIDENSGAGQVVYTATVEGSDPAITFSLSSDSDAALTIDSATGAVSLTTDPDFEVQDSYAFTVIATDAAGNESAPQAVTLSINNLDEVAPIITSGDTASVIDENSGAGQVIYTATADDSADTSDGVIFSLTPESDPALTIDSDTGAVSLTTDPDFEAQDSYAFTVVATDAAGNESAPQAVTLSINNLDEVAPTITSGATVGSIDENSGAGQVIYTATSDDSADVSDGVIFSLAGDSDPALSIDPTTGEVTLSADANYEVQSVYSFTVVASDGVNEAVEQSVTLDINNLDEIAPSITSGDAAVAIDENTGAGTVIYTATADDSLDISAGVTFSLTGDSDPALSIDPSTGAVTLSADADYETQSVYSFTVVASDGVNGDVEQSVTLDINNLDEIAPSITSGDTAVAIDENTGADTVIYTAIADDSLDISAGVTFSLTGESDPALSIDPSTGAVILSADADYETQSQYSFTVVASDGVNGDVEQSVTLDVNNLDEIAPIITSDASTTTSVNENTGAGQVVYTATASDGEDASDGFSFSLADESLGFSIDASTGVVTTNADFAADFEDAQSQSFIVIATDEAGNSSEQVVSIAINNLDEIAPTITSGDSAAVLESSGADALVYRAIINDAADISAGVTFTLSEGHDPALSIDEVTGEVTLTDVPDAKIQEIYLFTVIADDGVNQSQKAVTLSVIDEDLEAPVFTSSATVAIDENIGENQVIYTAVTEDESLVTYSISEDSDTDLSINSDTGAVTLTTNPDHESQSEYSFTVIATDVTGNTSQQPVSVAINNLDEFAPSITSGDTGTAVNENSGAGQVIYTATASDTDFNGLEDITFSLADDSLGFSIDASTGVVITNTDFESNFEDAQSQSFTVVATDAAGNASEQVVSVAINNLDEVAPVINSGDTGTAVNENSGADQVVLHRPQLLILISMVQKTLPSVLADDSLRL
jgi:hypothetical protein